MNIVILQAGLRVPSTTRMLADELGRALTGAAASADTDLDVQIVDLRDHAHAIMDAMLSGFAAGELQAVLDAVLAADGLVVVTPTFQGSYSGLFKSFADLIEPGALTDTPVVLAATGGTARHSLMLEFALRPLMVYLGADPLRTAVFAATGDFGSSELSGRATRVAGELLARASGSGASRVQGAGAAAGGAAAGGADRGALAEKPSTEPEVVDFESLMDSLGVGR
ncbi:NAD(P)H-dependent oxidoreductase [Aestuariimicrobium sp. p3-SID1156]|uniref:CE1759 family FMN reductase n=1 Tax=Aestuariimicrobium sp. p3-SID1156 TaxID=2916038 RepID=UPI00223B8BE3|nr:CE1759 family FMN reductase [Aestuariimicrobium sp. p3-SID1156]MCT1459349.1 NAD(P)H-dependent oxidoreductase [Aestuariimicrobium sp. p3-SID1156]